MDSIFHLNPHARRRFLRTVGRTLGCVYICLWSHFPHLSNCFISTDAWFNEEESSSLESAARLLFNAYLGSLCRIDNSCVPGLAYKQGLAYLELGASELMDVTEMPVQRQFYQGAGIKTAVFMGCTSGEIELGMPTSSNNNLQMHLGNLFGEDLIQQSQLGEHTSLPDQSRQSSSSSSFRSLSVSSPEYSSLLLNKSSTSSLVPDVASKEIVTTDQQQQLSPILVSQHRMGIRSYSPYGGANFPTWESDEAAMTRAMLAVISASSSYQPPQPAQTQQSTMNRLVGAFRPYNPSLAPRIEPKMHSRSQRMVKGGISILRRINWVKAEGRLEESRPTSMQLHHMIAERKRREKLNDSFLAVRSLLPPGTKKDKASVLTSAKDYMSSLKAQVSELEEKNKILEQQLLFTDETNEEAVGDSSERVSLQIIKASESSSQVQRITLRIIVRVDSDIIELLLSVLHRLKEMGDISLISADARRNLAQRNTSGQLMLALEIKASDWDEESFKEAISSVVDGVVAKPEPQST